MPGIRPSAIGITSLERERTERMCEVLSSPSFRRMLEVRRVLRHEALEKLLEVAARGRIGVLHHDEAAARLPNEHGYMTDQAVDSILANISTRGFVHRDNVMIGGFILGGGEDGAEVLIRAPGPSLTHFGVVDASPDPTLESHNADGDLAGSTEIGNLSNKLRSNP